MENLSLNAQSREEAKGEGNIPAVIYGKDFKNQNLSINLQEFGKVYQEAGESTLVDLLIDDGKAVKVIIQELQRDPLTDKFIHVDFYKVKMDEAIETDIELEFVGVSQAVKELGGVLVKNRDTIKVKCLPQDLVKSIKVDISPLDTFEDIIRIKDLDIPEKIEVLEEGKITVTLVSPPRTEEELEALDKKVEEDVEGVEVEGAEEGEEDEEAVEGESASAEAPADKEGEEGEKGKEPESLASAKRSGGAGPDEGGKEKQEKK